MEISKIELLLGREFAQKDKNFLDYCVPREDILDRIRNPQRSFFLIVAPRGSGKSGLLLILEDELRRMGSARNRVIKKYYEDVTFSARMDDVDTSVQHWMTLMLEWIVTDIGTSIEVPETPDEIFAVELAESRGLREQRNQAQRPEPHFEFENIRFIAKRLLARTNLRFWLLLDEMDDYYSNTQARNNALVGLLQASDAITTFSDQVLVRLTIRPHIHTYLKTNFDVVQKFRDAELPLHWNEVQLRSLLVRRIQRFDRRLSRDQPELILDPNPPDRYQPHREACEVIGRYFQDFDAGLRPDKKTDYRALQTLSLRRPRWMIEYCWLALQASTGDYADLAAFIKAMHAFGRNRLHFLAGEHKAHLPNLMAWVNGLTAARKSVFGSSEDFRDIIIQYVLRTDATSVGIRQPSPQELADSLHIAQALYMLEIVRAHQHAGGKDDHRFYTYADSPELLSSWSDRANLTWGMHETFARALNIIENNTYRVGGEIRAFGDRREGSAGKSPRHRPGKNQRLKDR
jgi:hypothetical protein